jgi:hypothetical protein
MKKFVVLLVVVALSCLGTAAFAADIAVSGSVDIRSRDFNDLNLTKDAPAVDAGNQRDTQERVRLTVDAKAGDVKGRITIENDWDTWGRLEEKQADASTATSENNTSGHGIGHSILDLREAWINFNLPGIPVNVNVGHQLLQLGNGWFLRNMKYGDDAWVLANVTGANTVAFVDIKAAEFSSAQANDIDGYALLDVFKLSDTMAVGIDLTNVKDRDAFLVGGNGVGAKNLNLQNIGLNFNGLLGPVNLKAELDFQMGKIETLGGAPEVKFKGNQIVIQATVPLDPVTINFTLARGSGSKAGDTDIKDMITILDADQHYTLLYEYKIPTPGINVVGAATNPGVNAGSLHTGFDNTSAISLGVSAQVSKSLNVGIDGWYLQSTEDVINGLGESTKKLGDEIDAHINWAMYDNLSWNWQIGYFKPGDAYKNVVAGVETGKDAATGIQGVLSFKF